MSDCSTIDPLITPYFDGEIDADTGRRVDEHVRRCPPCHSRVAAERAVRQVVRLNRAQMSRIAAGLVLVVGGAFVYEATERSPRLLAAELTADHVKCFGMNALRGTNPDAAVIEQAMASTFGWEVRVPQSGEAGLELVGARPCFYGKGKA